LDCIYLFVVECEVLASEAIREVVVENPAKSVVAGATGLDGGIGDPGGIPGGVGVQKVQA
jgi:hypothetical protein